MLILSATHPCVITSAHLLAVILWQGHFESSVRIFETHADDFIAVMKRMLGDACMTSKMHGLLHVSEDLRRLNQQLYGMSTYPFETALMKFKTWLRSGNKPLTQIQ